MNWRDVPGRYWLMLGSLAVTVPLLFFWKDAVLIAGFGTLAGLGLTLIDMGWWPARRP